LHWQDLCTDIYSLVEGMCLKTLVYRVTLADQQKQDAFNSGWSTCWRPLTIKWKSWVWKPPKFENLQNIPWEQI